MRIRHKALRLCESDSRNRTNWKWYQSHECHINYPAMQTIPRSLMVVWIITENAAIERNILSILVYKYVYKVWLWQGCTLRKLYMIVVFNKEVELDWVMLIRSPNFLWRVKIMQTNCEHCCHITIWYGERYALSWRVLKNEVSTGLKS